jgi:hypothetical protein
VFGSLASTNCEIARLTASFIVHSPFARQAPSVQERSAPYVFGTAIGLIPRIWAVPTVSKHGMMWYHIS